MIDFTVISCDLSLYYNADINMWHIICDSTAGVQCFPPPFCKTAPRPNPDHELLPSFHTLPVT